MINKDVVNKFADIIKKNFGLNPHFHTYRKSSHNEMLIVTFHSKNLYQKFRQMFYTKNNEKKIPKEIINASNDVLLKFIEGYVAGDGCYYENGKGKFWKIFDKSPNVITALAFLEKKLGVEISCGLAKGHFTLRTVNNRIRDVNRAKIRKIIELPYEGYVYDIETPNHVFYGGIGYPVKLHNSAWASKKGYDLSKIKEMPIHEFVLDSLTKADEYDKLAKEYEETVEALDFYRSRTHPIIRLEQGIQMLKEFLEMALLMDALGIDIIDSDVGQYYANLIQDYLLGRTKSFKA
jgi:intein/homing endonuclease